MIFFNKKRRVNNRGFVMQEAGWPAVFSPAAKLRFR